MQKRSALSRRSFLGAWLAGTTVLVAACRSPFGSAVPDARAGSLAINPGPGAATGGAVVARAAAPDLLVAVETATAVPAHAAARPVVHLPTPVPVAASSTPEPATATAVPTPTSEPTTIPYVESRLVDLLGQSVTSYAGSVPPRVFNVQLATRRIDGARVAPGAVFSFDDTVGDQTQAGGFKVAWGIISNNGVPETVEADAGGICQVATTLFQAVYWAGLPIVRRFHHLYWIAHYGQPPYGRVGLDATVDFAPVDFQFRNTTNDWIRIAATYDSTHVHMRLLGVDPGWKVSVGTPKIFNLVKTDRTVVLRPDPSLPAGTELWVEAAEDAFDVTLERLVTKGSDTVDHYVFTNHYDPARNVKVIGTKGATPTPAATATATATASTHATTPTPVPPTATPAPASYRLANGQIRVPSLVGMTESQARSLIVAIGLQNAATNYQGPGNLPTATLDQVPVGAVLSQMPPAGTVVGAGATIYLAVRKA
jgi:hypothetical protein